jgi:hypothetical protein
VEGERETKRVGTEQSVKEEQGKKMELEPDRA